MMSTQNTTTSLKRYAESQGVEVIERHLPNTWPHALYIPELNTIYLEARQPHCYKRANLAHELGHVFYGHTTNSPKAERQADVFAAMQLIDPIEYRHAEAAYGTNEELLAYELGVTPHVIRVWRECIDRSHYETATSCRSSSGTHTRRLRRWRTDQGR